MGDVQRRADKIDPRAQLGAAHQALARAPPLNNSIVAFRNRERTRRIPLVLLRVHVAYVAVLARQTLAIVDPHPEAGGAGHAQVHAHAQFGGGVGAIGVVRAVCFLEGVEPVVVCSADSTERSSARGTERGTANRAQGAAKNLGQGSGSWGHSGSQRDHSATDRPVYGLGTDAFGDGRKLGGGRTGVLIGPAERAARAPPSVHYAGAQQSHSGAQGCGLHNVHPQGLVRAYCPLGLPSLTKMSGIPRVYYLPGYRYRYRKAPTLRDSFLPHLPKGTGSGGRPGSGPPSRHGGR